jgi:hypothetical protein
MRLALAILAAICTSVVSDAANACAAVAAGSCAAVRYLSPNVVSLGTKNWQVRTTYLGPDHLKGALQRRL